MKKLMIIVLAVLMLTLMGCATRVDSVESQEQYAVQQNMEEMTRQVGMPFIDDFFEKKMAKQIFELRDNADLITYVYTQNLNGQYVYLGKGIGFGLPYSVQYTNPEKVVNALGESVDEYWKNGRARVSANYPNIIIPQADPNGLYMPEGLSATWIMLINEDSGEPEIIYTEPSIVVTQSKLPKRLVAEWSLPNDY